MMRRWGIGCVVMVVLAGCGMPGLLQDPKQLMYLSMPQAARSEYFAVQAAGFNVNLEQKPGSVRYYLVLQLQRSLMAPLYLVIEFDDPRRRGQPLTETVEVQPGSTKVKVESEPVEGMRIGGSYRVLVTAYSDQAHTYRVDRLVQRVHSSISWEKLRSMGVL